MLIDGVHHHADIEVARSALTESLAMCVSVRRVSELILRRIHLTGSNGERRDAHQH